MATDIATLGIRIDSTSANTADDALDKLANTGAQTEKSMRGVETASRAMNASLAMGGAHMTRAAGAAKLTANEALNLSRQFADIGVTAAMGMSPFMILIQQGPQIADIMKTANIGIGGVAIELLRLVGIVRINEVSIAATAAQTIRLSVAETELAAATAATAAAQNFMTVTTDRLSASRVLATATAREAAAAEELLAAQAGTNNSKAVTSLTRLGGAAIAVAAIAVTVGTAFAIATKEVDKQIGDVTKGMGLTEKQLDRIKDKGISTTVTIGDVFGAFFKVTGDRLQDAFEGPITWLKKAFDDAYNFIVEKGSWLIKETVGLFFGGYDAIVATWGMLPGAMADLFIQAVNFAATSINDMVDAGLNGLDRLLANVPAWLAPGGTGITKQRGGWVPTVDNPYAGQASATGDAASAAMGKGRARGRKAASSFYDDMISEARKGREDALREAGGDAEKGPSAKKSGAEKEYERQVKAAQDFIKSLKEETSEIGKNRIEIKMQAAERAAALAPTQKLKDEITEASKAWKAATFAEATRQLKQELSDLNEQTEFETSLLTMNAKEKEVANAKMMIALKLRALEREGIVLSAEAIAKETNAILKNAEAKGQQQLDIDNANNLADAMWRQADAIKTASDAFGDYFGKGVQGFADMISAQAEWAAERADIEARIEEAKQRGAEGDAERAVLEAQLASGQINNYANILGAAKNMFNEKSKGYKILQAVEMAYRMFQFAMSVKAMLFDSAETTSSVAKSGVRAAAHGVEAVVKAIASLPFPLNLVAGAATLAAITALGVSIFGGGGGGGGAASAAANDNNADDTGFNVLNQASGNYNVSKSASSSSSAANPSLPTMSDNSSNSSSGNNLRVVIENAPPGYYVEEKSRSDGELRMMMRSEIKEMAPKVVAQDMGNSASPTARAIKSNFEVAARR